jgi:hypothetical protein
MRKKLTKFESVPRKPFILNNITLTYQDLGTNWLLILEGAKQDIEYAFYSFYNLGATNTPEALVWGMEDEKLACVAWFWTTPYKLKKYFKARFTAIHLNEGKNQSFVSDTLAARYAEKMMKDMNKTPCNFHFGIEIACHTVAEYCEQNHNNSEDNWVEHSYKTGMDKAESEIRGSKVEILK